MVNARSALFDLYGDHLSSRGGVAPVAALVRLLGALGIAPPAVRTAVSRLVRQDWLVAARTPTGPGYAMTDRARRRLDAAGARIYRTDLPAWDGCWHLLAVEPIRERSRRERLRAGLQFLGYGALDDRTWVATRRSSELAGLLAEEDVKAEAFLARHDGDSAAMVARVWDLPTLDAAYREWMVAATSRLSAARLSASRRRTPPDVGFAVRSELVHSWRKFLFVDPALPAELLPRGWGGIKAAELFDREAARLLPATTEFIDACLTGESGAPDA